MRIVTKHEDEQTRSQIDFLKDLVDELRTEILQLRAQIDEAREIPPFPFNPREGKPAQVHVLNDKNMAKIQRGEKLDETS